MISVNLYGEEAVLSHGVWSSSDALLAAKLNSILKDVVYLLEGYHPDLEYAVAKKVIDTFGTGEVVYQSSTSEEEVEDGRVY